MNTGLASADLLIVAGFFLVMLGIGVYFANRMKNLKDYFSGSRRVPWWVSGVSLYMTTFSAFAFVAYSALAYKHGFVAITIWWSGVPCCLAATWLLAARWRRAAATSPVEYIETRYSPSLRQGFAWLGVPLLTIDDALKLFVIGKMVTVSMGATSPSALPLAIVVCGLIMLAYTFLGGLWAAMVTDFVQFVVMAASVLILVPLALMRVGGPAALVERSPEGFWALTGGDYTWAWLIPFFLVQFFAYGSKWSYVQRFYSVGSDAEARKVGYLVAALTFFGMPLLFLPAMAARVFMPGASDANDVYMLLCKQLLPVGMMGMMIASMFSATMSTLSGDYNAVASVVTNDIYRRLFARHAGEKALVLAGRVATLAVGLASLGIALLLARAEDKKDLVEYMAQLFSVLMPPVAIPMMFGLLTRKVSNAGGTAGFLAGAVFGIAAYLVSYREGLEYLRGIPYLPWITSAPTLAFMALFSMLMPDSNEKRAHVSRFLDGLEKRGPKAVTRSGSSTEAAGSIGVIGVATAAMGIVLIAAVAMTGYVRQGWLSVCVGIVMIAGGLTIQASAKGSNKKASTGTAGEDNG